MDTNEIIGGASIIALDGVEGFIHVVRVVVRWLRDDPDLWIDGSYTFELDELLSKSVGRSILEREALADMDIARYLAAEREMEKPSPSNKYRMNHTTRLLWTAAQIVEYAEKETTDSCRWFIRWGKCANPEERKLVFAALLDKHDKQKFLTAQCLWWCFYQVAAPHWES